MLSLSTARPISTALTSNSTSTSTSTSTPTTQATIPLEQPLPAAPDAPHEDTQTEVFPPQLNRLQLQPTQIKQKISSYLDRQDSAQLSQVNKDMSLSLSTRGTVAVDKWRMNLGQDYEKFEVADHLIRLRQYTLPDLVFSEQDCAGKAEFFKHLAASCRNLYLFLRKHPERVNEQDEEGMTILHHAASAGLTMGSNSASLIHSLLFNAPGIDFSIKNSNGDTAVHVAGFYGEERVTCRYIFPNYVRKAAELGFDFSTRGQRGYTVLHLAVLHAYESWPMGRARNLSTILSILLEHQIPNLKAVLDTLSDSGSSALFYAINRLSLSEARELLAAGADPELGGSPDRTPLGQIATFRAEFNEMREKLEESEESSVQRLDAILQDLSEFEQQLKKTIGSSQA